MNLRFHVNALKDYPNYDALLASAVNREGDYVTIDTDGAAYKATLPPARPSRGFGDTVAKVLKRVGVKPCAGCQKRRDKLNKLIPYRKPSPSFGISVEFSMTA